jgi:PAS domain S-box-containing protein
METEAETKKGLIEDPADLRQQPACVKNSRPEAKYSQQALQASETRYRRLFETAQDGILILNAETGKIDDVNPYMIDMLHYSYEEFLGKQLWEVSPFKNTGLNIAAFEELQDKGYIRYKDLPLETKEGKSVAVEFVSNVYKANGNKVIQCNIRNITERKEATRKLQEAVIFQQQLIDALPVPVFYKDLEGRYLGCNSSFEKFFGQKREQITGRSAYELAPKEMADIYHEKDRALLQNPGIQVYESIVKDAGGVVHNVIFHKATFPNTDGSVGGLIGGILDITDCKRTEGALRESEKKYRLLVDNMSDVITVMDMNLHFTYVSPSIMRLRGYTVEEAMAQTMEQMMTPESLQIVAKVFEEELKLEAGGTADPGRSRIVELEEYRKDGSVVWSEDHLSFIRDETQKPVSIISLSRDITDRKQWEKSLRESEKKYRLVVDNMADVITVMDLNLRFTYVSPSVMRLRGYTAEEVMSQTMEQVLTPESLQIVAKAFEEELILEAGGTADPGRSRILELEEYRKDGSTVWLENHMSTLRDNEKKLIGIIALSHDITDRKQAEEKLRQTLESLRKAFGATVQVMVSAVESRDPYTAGHQLRSANLARAIATEMGLPLEKIEGIRMAGSIHDIGKLSIPAEILSKPTKLTSLEFSLIKEHSRNGYEMLKDVESPWPLAQIVYQHHERMDGSGYPRNMKGDDILMEARIMAVADVVEAMASHRPYRPALGIDAALDEIEQNKGKLYDPAVVDACLNLFHEKDYCFN